GLFRARPAAEYGAGGEPLRLRGLLSSGLFLLERALDAGDVVGIERRHVIVHFEAERTDLRDQVLVGDPDLFRNLIHSHLLSGHPSLRWVPGTRDAVSTAFPAGKPAEFFTIVLRISSGWIARRSARCAPPL